MDIPTTRSAPERETTAPAGLVDADRFLAVTTRLHELRDRLAEVPRDHRHRGRLHARLAAIADAAASSLEDVTGELDELERDLADVGRE